MASVELGLLGTAFEVIVGEVVTREELLARVADARSRGQTVAFANGCFDLLHVGHTRYLEAAAQEADLLVVAINDDESVRALKGGGRPLVAAGHRAELIAALRCVDLVTVFAETTVGPLLEALRPDVHCKGTDYTVETVPERAIVEAYGGRTAIVGDRKEHSTKGLVDRMRERTSPSKPKAQSPKPKAQSVNAQRPGVDGSHVQGSTAQSPNEPRGSGSSRRES